MDEIESSTSNAEPQPTPNTPEQSESTQPDHTLPLRSATSEMIRKITETVDEEKFRNCFDFLKSQLPESKFKSTIQKLHKSFSDNLIKELENDLGVVWRNEEFKAGLALLNDLKAEALASRSTTADAWRPPGNVSQHQRTPDMFILDNEIKITSSTLNELESENERIILELQNARTNIIKLHQKAQKGCSQAMSIIQRLQQMRNHMPDGVFDS